MTDLEISRALALANLNFERFDALFRYDKDTGVLTRKTQRGTAKAGSVAGSLNDQGYLLVMVDGRNQRVHRIAWLLETGAWPTYDIDHINGNRSDNRFSNLRDVTTSVNIQNQKQTNKATKSGFLGVRKDRNRWAAQIQLNGKNLHVGMFDTPEEAHAAYLAKKREIHKGCTI